MIYRLIYQCYIHILYTYLSTVYYISMLYTYKSILHTYVSRLILAQILQLQYNFIFFFKYINIIIPVDCRLKLICYILEFLASVYRMYIAETY